VVGEGGEHDGEGSGRAGWNRRLRRGYSADFFFKAITSPGPLPKVEFRVETQTLNIIGGVG